jgi:hypothetical protein
MAQDRIGRTRTARITQALRPVLKVIPILFMPFPQYEDIEGTCQGRRRGSTAAAFIDLAARFLIIIQTGRRT